MPDLKYDTDTMREVAAIYRNTASTLTQLENTLKKQIADLKNTYWKSEAGDAFQSKYEDSWMKNVDKYIAVLQEMSTELDHAAREYDTVTAKLKEIDGISV